MAKKNLERRRERAINEIKKTIAKISSLQKKIAKYAARRSISVEQATDELGINGSGNYRPKKEV